MGEEEHCTLYLHEDELGQTYGLTCACQIADGQRELIRTHSVKNRHFIGNTSMDAGLSLIMTNHAKVKENDLIFDPFVGTGKIVKTERAEY